MSCNHIRTSSYWVNEEVDDYGTIIPGHWEHSVEYTTIDLDTHRYKCTQCKEVMYYSGAAREYYETGVDRKGLFQNE